jgi:tetratricopeptide (TPR) repeat protein
MHREEKMPSPSHIPIEVFYSYAHEDKALRHELEKHLSLLHRQGLISSWHDRQIVPGTDWAKAINEHLETASLILLLISADFLASDYCYGIEMERALQRHEAGVARVIPILVRPVNWQGAPFEHLQSLPTDTRPITTWDNQDEGFANIATGIRQAIEDLTQLRTSVPTEQRYAICIGINQYPSSLGTLDYAEQGAQAMYGVLREIGFTQDNCRLLRGEEATLEAINAALEDIILDKASENDLVVFYFAGYSVPLTVKQVRGQPQSEVFLASADFDGSKILASRSFRTQHALGMERLRQTFFEGESPTKRLFIFDSCYSGDFYRPNYHDNVDPVQGYIQHILDSGHAGRTALLSFRPLQKAAEDSALQHGRFTHHLLEALSGKAPEALRTDGCLTLNSLFEYLVKKLPENQRPALSGVQQDTFELIYYRNLVEMPPPSSPSPQNTAQTERDDRLRALLSDHKGFISNRLASFVGRQKELAEIQLRIQEKTTTGGYITITGQAGQGKSSVIAKLVEGYGIENTAFHFIPLNPGPDHQVGLLRNLMARLILKYQLSEIYVASDSRPALRDYFPRILAELAAMGKQEVIFLDGLDQLEEEYNGTRDLSFLPNDLPPGIVFVLGTRPNDTLRPLELLKPHYEYQLPNMSRHDFDLILEHRHVQLDKVLADQFYQAMQENALYLDLVAKELAERRMAPPLHIIKQITSNPDNLFSLSIARLKRLPLLWREVVKPILGVLLVAQEPLTKRHLRQILVVDEDQLNEGLERLGGLIADNGQRRYALFHLRLRDYLRQDEANPDGKYVFASDEEEGWHKTLANWCEKSLESDTQTVFPHRTLEDGCREYARWHYVTHLYYAREWQRLFSVLDEVEYGRAKIYRDLSMRSYMQDLDIGRQAILWEGWTFDERVQLLPKLWQYTWLRSNLTNRADQYSSTAFLILVSLGRQQEAIGLAEMLTEPTHKMQVLLDIAKQVGKEPIRGQECVQILLRACEVARRTKDDWWVTYTLSELGKALAQTQQWERVKSIVALIESHEKQAEVLCELGRTLALTQQLEQAQVIWDQAKTVITLIESHKKRAEALCELGRTLALTQQLEQAQGIWDQAETLITLIERDSERTEAQEKLCAVLIQTRQWERAEATIRTVEDKSAQIKAHAQLARALILAHQWQQAQTVIDTIEDFLIRVKALAELSQVLAEEHQLERAETTWEEIKSLIHTASNSDEKAKALIELGRVLAQVQHCQQAEEIWANAETLISDMKESYEKIELLRYINQVKVRTLAQTHQWEQAETAISTIRWGLQRMMLLSELANALVNAKQWERAQAVIHQIEWTYIKAGALQKLSEALARDHQMKQAEIIRAEADELIPIQYMTEERTTILYDLGDILIHLKKLEDAALVVNTIQNADKKAQALCQLSQVLAQEHQWEQAEATIDGIDRVVERVRALRELAKAMTHAQQEAQAKAVWTKVHEESKRIEERNARADAHCELAKALVEVHQWEQAETAIHSISNLSVKVELLCQLAATLALAKQTTRAAMIWKEIDAIAHTITTPSERVEILSVIATTLAYTQQWKRVNTVWIEIEEIHKHIEKETGMDSVERRKASNYAGTRLNNILKTFAQALVQAKRWERAQAVIELIDGSEKSEALYDLGKALAHARQWEQTQVVIDRIDGTKRLEALYELGKALAHAQQWEQAQAVIARIEGSRRSEALYELGKALAHAQQWEQAQAVITKIEDSMQRIKALSELGVALAQAQQQKQADILWIEVEMMIHNTPINNLMPNIVREITKMMATVHEYERLLHIVQDIWIRADTRKQVALYLPIVNEIIVLNPELGVSFYQSLIKVDAFLKE